VLKRDVGKRGGVVFNCTMRAPPLSLGPNPSTKPKVAPRFDRSDFHALVEQSSGLMYRLAARITGNEQDAQDVLQESFVRAFEALAARGFEPRASPQTWLYRIVTNVALNSLRERGRSRRREESWSQPGSDSVRSMDAVVALREMSQWLDLLPEDQRVALILKEVEGLSTAQVAEVLGCSEGAIEQRLVRGRDALRERSRDE
jgi:RNA polymerase sigma-70 factor (ECF subfamily)